MDRGESARESHPAFPEVVPVDTSSYVQGHDRIIRCAWTHGPRSLTTSLILSRRRPGDLRRLRWLCPGDQKGEQSTGGPWRNNLGGERTNGDCIEGTLERLKESLPDVFGIDPETLEDLVISIDVSRLLQAPVRRWRPDGRVGETPGTPETKSV